MLPQQDAFSHACGWDAQQTVHLQGSQHWSTEQNHQQLYRGLYNTADVVAMSVPSLWKASLQCQQWNITIWQFTCPHLLMCGCETVHAQHGKGTNTHLGAKKLLMQHLLWELSFPLCRQICKAGNTGIGNCNSRFKAKGKGRNMVALGYKVLEAQRQQLSQKRLVSFKRWNKNTHPRKVSWQ